VELTVTGPEMGVKRYHVELDAIAKEHFKSCGTVAVDPPSIAAGAAANVDVTVTGLETTDHVVVVCKEDLEAGLIPVAAYVPAANTLRIRLYNPTAAAIDGASRTWAWFAFK